MVCVVLEKLLCCLFVHRISIWCWNFNTRSLVKSQHKNALKIQEVSNEPKSHSTVPSKRVPWTHLSNVFPNTFDPWIVTCVTDTPTTAKSKMASFRVNAMIKLKRHYLRHRVIYGVESWNGVVEWSGVEFGVEWSLLYIRVIWKERLEWSWKMSLPLKTQMTFQFRTRNGDVKDAKKKKRIAKTLSGLWIYMECPWHMGWVLWFGYHF